MMTMRAERRLSVTQSLRVPQPKAWIRSAISRLAKILAVVALATLRILPRIGRIACVLRSRACLAEPPAESPWPMKLSVPAGPLAGQSASFPGRHNFGTDGVDFAVTTRGSIG